MRIPILISLLLFIAGCQTQQEPIAFDTKGLQPAADYSHLDFILSRSVNSKHQLMPDALDAYKGRLRSQLAILSITGPAASPQLFPTPEDRLAYWYNAAAAWSMQLALAGGYPKEMPDLHQRKFTLDGKTMSLDDIRAELAKDGDFRVPLLMPCVCFNDGSLPAKAFSGRNFRQCLAQRFDSYIDDSRRFVIDIEQRAIIFPPELWKYREQIISQYQQKYGAENVQFTTALLPYTTGSAHRRLQDAVGYRQIQGRANPILALPGKFDFLIKR